MYCPSIQLVEICLMTYVLPTKVKNIYHVVRGEDLRLKKEYWRLAPYLLK